MRVDAWNTIAVVAVFVVVIAVAVLILSRREEPHVLWVSNGITLGENLKLFESGKYTSEPWCDICQANLFRGTWKKSGNILTLTPNETDRRTRQLLIIEKYGCQFLHDVAYPQPPIDISPSRISPSDFTNVDDCSERVMERDFRELQLKRHGVSSNNSFKPRPLIGSA